MLLDQDWQRYNTKQLLRLRVIYFRDDVAAGWLQMIENRSAAGHDKMSRYRDGCLLILSIEIPNRVQGRGRPRNSKAQKGSSPHLSAGEKLLMEQLRRR